MTQQENPTQGFPASVRCALAGLASLVTGERNARIHLVASLVVTAAGLGLGLGASEWCWIVLAMAAVWTAEAFNTALERLADAVAPERDPRVGGAKDVAAGGVLVAAMGAAVIGLLVLGPHVVELGSHG